MSKIKKEKRQIATCIKVNICVFLFTSGLLHGADVQSDGVGTTHECSPVATMCERGAL